MSCVELSAFNAAADKACNACVLRAAKSAESIAATWAVDMAAVATEVNAAA